MVVKKRIVQLVNIKVVGRGARGEAANAGSGEWLVESGKWRVAEQVTVTE